MTISDNIVIDTYGIDGQVHFELNEDFNLISKFIENGSDQEILLQDIPKELSNISDIDTLKKYLVKTHSKMSESSDGSLHLDIYRKLDGGLNLKIVGLRLFTLFLIISTDMDLYQCMSAPVGNFYKHPEGVGVDLKFNDNPSYSVSAQTRRGGGADVGLRLGGESRNHNYSVDAQTKPGGVDIGLRLKSKSNPSYSADLHVGKNPGVVFGMRYEF